MGVEIIIGRVGGCGQNGRGLSRIFLLAGWQLCHSIIYIHKAGVYSLEMRLGSPL